MRSARQVNHQPTEQVNASYRELRRERAERERRWKVEEERTGAVGAWLALTAPPQAPTSASVAERERRRKAELSAYVIFGVLLMGIALIPSGLGNRPTLISAILIIVAAGVAAALNRADRTTAAALLLVGALSVAVGGALLAAPVLDLTRLAALDFFAVPVLLTGLLLSRRAPFVVAGLATGAVVALLELKPRDAALTHLVAQQGIYPLLVRPITLLVVVALASWLWARSVEQAITRADRAEEIAAIEHALAEQKRQMDAGVQSLLETHVRVANGDFSARAATGQENALWQIGVSLNNLLSRLSKLARADQRLQRTETEIDRLATALEAAHAGTHGSWPTFSGTRVDRLLRVLASTQQQRLPAPRLPQPAWPADDLAPAEVPEGVPGGKIPPWDGSGLTPIVGVWRAEAGHYSTARGTLADYGSGSLRAQRPPTPPHHMPPEDASDSGPIRTSAPDMPDPAFTPWVPMRGPGTTGRLVPDPFGSPLPDTGSLAATSGPTVVRDQPTVMRDQPQRAAPLSPLPAHTAPLATPRWSSGPLPPLPNAIWALPDPQEEEPLRASGQPGAPPPAGQRIVDALEPSSDNQPPGAPSA
jgi:hypothetical protein